MQKARRQFTKNLRPLVSARFQVLFHPLIQGTFHLSLTVLVHYRSLSRIQPYRMVPADSNGISPVPSYSGYHYFNKTYQYWAFTIYGLIFQKILVHFISDIVVLQPLLCRNIIGLGCFLFARHYSGNHYCFLFLWLLRCFSSPGLPTKSVTCLQHAGFPHSEIYGSNRMCQSPQLIAAYHVLHRL